MKQGRESGVDHGSISQRAAQLIGNAVVQAIIGMTAAGELEGSLGIQILKRVEEEIRKTKMLLPQEKGGQSH